MSRVKVNVSGSQFEFSRKILEKRDYHTLTKMCEEADSNGSPLEFFVDRPSDCFAAILSFYQTDELHMPTVVCPKAFRNELNYWGVPETDLDKCCLYRYYTFFDDFETHELFREETFSQNVRDGLFIPTYKDNMVNRVRHKIWKVIDCKEDTVKAKVYLLMVFLMTLLCIVTLAFSTVPAFQRKLQKCELLEFLEHSQHEFAEKAKAKLGDPDCSGFLYDDMDDLEDTDLHWEEVNEYYVDGNLTTSKTNINLPIKTVPLFVFDVLGMITASFFTLDLLLRMLCNPCLIRFFRSVINMFDILALTGFYIHIAVINIAKEHKYNISWIRLINYLQIFRVMRLFRVVKNVRASRVLTFSLRQNGRDMTLLVLLVMICVSTAASLIYFIEDRDVISSIPAGWYWAMITLTTVGYGDITPKSSVGRIVSAILAICGVLLLAITLPMFVNNFITLYKYSCVDETIQERTKNKQKLKGAIHVSTIGKCKRIYGNECEALGKGKQDQIDYSPPIYVLPGEAE